MAQYPTGFAERTETIRDDIGEQGDAALARLHEKRYTVATGLSEYYAGALGVMGYQSHIREYCRNYKSFHVGRALSSYGPNNLFCTLSKQRISTQLIGKVCGIFQAELPAIVNLPVIDAPAIASALQAALASKTRFIFVNFQDVDLQCHARNAALASDKLQEICRYIDQARNQLTEEDLLLITGDHGNDPSSDDHAHSREFVPVIIEGGAGAPKGSPGLGCVRAAVEQHLLR